MSLEPPVRVLADATGLAEGESVRFRILLDGVDYEAFALRWRGRWHAYVNRCRHQLLPLDFGDGHLLDAATGRLVCVHHGAEYEPDSGRCVAGPCEGANLTVLALEEREGGLWCLGRA